MKSFKKYMAFALTLCLIVSLTPITTLAVEAPICAIVDYYDLNDENEDGINVYFKDEYASLDAALADAADGDVIYLFQSIDYVKNSSSPAILILNKTITFDVGIYTLNISNNAGTAVKVDSGGHLLLKYEEGGALNVSSGGGYGRGISVHGGGTATVTSASAGGGGTIAAYVESEVTDESVLTVLGDVTAGEGAQYGACISNGGRIDIGGNAVSTGYVYSTVTCWNGTLSVENIQASGRSAYALSAGGGGKITVRGDIYADGSSYYARGVSVGERGTVIVKGDITVRGCLEAVGLSAGSGSSVTVNGSVTACSTSSTAYGVRMSGQDYDAYDTRITAGATVTVNGDITAQSGSITENAAVGIYTQAFSSAKDSGSTITVNGEIIAETYVLRVIKFGKPSVMARGMGTAGTGDFEGYWIYSDGMSEVRALGISLDMTSLNAARVGEPYRMASSYTYYPGSAHGGTLTFSAVGLPQGLRIDETTGVIDGTPVAGADANTPYMVILAASDGEMRVEKHLQMPVSAAPGTTYTLTFFNIGSAYANKTIDAGTSVGDDEWPDDPTRRGYTFGGWFTEKNGGGKQVTSRTIINYSQTVYAKWTSTGQATSSDGTVTTKYEATVSGDGSGKLPVMVRSGAGSASTELVSTASRLVSSSKAVTVSMPEIDGVTRFGLSLSVASLSSGSGDGSLTLHTGFGSITAPSDMLTRSGVSGTIAQINIGKGDQSSLSGEAKTAVGDRPLVELSLSVDGAQTDWSNPDAPVTVSIPYAPAEGEDLNAIVIWYIDGNGKLNCVTNGRFDQETGRVTFQTTHFSLYAVGYNAVSFTDVANTAWYADAVRYLAARAITAGSGNNKFIPDATLTRGQFITLLLRAYEIAPDDAALDNFSDAGETYYTGYLAAAKRLGISSGVGDNKFEPEKAITRQEMFTLLYNALRVLDALPEGNSDKMISDFSDGGDIAAYAKEAVTALVETGMVSGSGGKLTPASTTTRAQIAQVLYNLLSE